jgi:hypothetical protein
MSYELGEMSYEWLYLIVYNSSLISHHLYLITYTSSLHFITSY